MLNLSKSVILIKVSVLFGQCCHIPTEHASVLWLFLLDVTTWCVSFEEEDTSVDDSVPGKNILNMWIIGYRRNNMSKH